MLKIIIGFGNIVGLSKKLTYTLGLFFIIGIFISPKIAKAANQSDLTCKIEKFNKCTQVWEDGKNKEKCDVCDINQSLSPQLKFVANEDIEKVSETNYKVTLKWEKPKLLQSKSGCGGRISVETTNTAPLLGYFFRNTRYVAETKWDLRNYILNIKKGNETIKTEKFGPEDKCTNDGSGVSKYVFDLSLSQAPPDEGIKYTVEVIANHHHGYDPSLQFIGDDLWIFSDPQSFIITKAGGQTGATDYSPVITGAQAVIDGSVGTARLQWKKPKAVIDKKATLEDPGYIFRRKRVENQQFFSQEKLTPTNFTDLGGEIVSGDDKTIDMKDLSNGTCLEYEYFVKANFKRLGDNYGLSPNGRKLKFCKDKDGKYTGSDQGETAPVDVQDTTQATSTGGTSGFDCGCEEAIKKDKSGWLIKNMFSMICGILCWVFNMIIDFVVLISTWAKQLPM